MKLILFKLKTILFYGYTRKRLLSIAQLILAILGALWLGMEIYAFFFADSAGLVWVREWVAANMGVILILIALISLLIITPKIRISQTIADTDIQIEIKFTDIWAEKGAKVISGIDTFDTDIGRGLVSPGTLHGQMIQKFYNGDIERIDAEISAFMKAYHIEPEKTDEKLKGKQDRYKIGTTVILKPKDQYIYFLALSSMRPKGNVEIKAWYIDQALSHLWDFIEQSGQQYNDVINIPVLGTGKKKLPSNYTNQFILYRMIESFATKVKKQPFCRKLCICLYNKDFHQYDLNQLSHFLTYYVNEYLVKK